MRFVGYFGVLAVVYLLAASSAVNEFLVKWRTLNNEQYGLCCTLDYDVPRPYANRVLMPFLVNESARQGAVLWIVNRPIFLDRGVERYMAPGTVEHWSRDLRIKYVIAGAWMVGFMMLALFSLRGITLALFPRALPVADVGPIIFALVLPLTFRGETGFIYDFAELGLYFLGLWFLVCGRVWLLLLLLPLIVLNKESGALLWCFSAVVLIRNLPIKRAVAHLVAQGTLIGCVLLIVRTLVSGQGGGVVEWHLSGNLCYWLSPSTYMGFMTAGVAFFPIPKPYNVLMIPLCVALGAYGWASKPVIVKRLFVLAVLLNLPLFLCCCYRAELRNLSLVFPFYYLVVCDTVIQWYDRHNVQKSGDVIEQKA